jgi:predicted TPR repeat methyltransferase
MDSNFDHARALFLEGVALYEADRLREAELKFSAALSLAPGRPSILTNLGAVRLRLGRVEEAVALLQEAVAREPDNAEALGHCGAALAESGQPREALAMFERSLAADDRRPTVWTLRGNVLKELGRRDEAAASFQGAIERGGDAELNRYYLAGLAAGEPPRQAPPAYVQALFDGYAAGFDAHLQELRYQAPRLLLERLEAAGRRYEHALDLGCGTGLCGPFLRRMATRVTGVDLSPNMLDRAQTRGCYDVLLQAEAGAFLAASQERFDLVVAADVFIYVGALETLFAELARRMPVGGHFCCTVEAATRQELELRSSLRYAHSEGYLRRLAEGSGFALTALEEAPVRHDQQQPVPGLFAWMERV